MASELMTAMVTGISVVSDITLALLQDTGW